MKTLIIAGVALLATAATAQPRTRAADQDNPNDTICRMVTETGSRLNRTRVCMTRAQWAQQRRETRESVDRAQNLPQERQYGG